jgi:hypothetical protein
MLEFMVLGRIPGTNVQISFAALLAASFLLFSLLGLIKLVGNWRLEKLIVSLSVASAILLTKGHRASMTRHSTLSP